MLYFYPPVVNFIDKRWGSGCWMSNIPSKGVQERTPCIYPGSLLVLHRIANFTVLKCEDRLFCFTCLNRRIYCRHAAQNDSCRYKKKCLLVFSTTESSMSAMPSTARMYLRHFGVKMNKNISVWSVQTDKSEVKKWYLSPKKIITNGYSKWAVWHQCHCSTWPVRLLSPSGSELTPRQSAEQPNCH